MENINRRLEELQECFADKTPTIPLKDFKRSVSFQNRRLARLRGEIYATAPGWYENQLLPGADVASYWSAVQLFENRHRLALRVVPKVDTQSPRPMVADGVSP